MSKPMRIMLIITGLLFGAIFGFHVFKSIMVKKYLANMQDPAVTVSTMKVTHQLWQPKLVAAGSLRATQGVDVTTEIGGIVKKISFTPGSKATAGQAIVELNADADIALLHSLQAAADLAKTTYKRDKAQYAVQAISKAALDIDAADLKSKEANVAQQAAIVAKKTILAPFNGYLGISNVNPGQFVNPGDNIVTLQALDPIYVDFYIPEQVLSQIAIDQTVIINSDTYPDTTFKGKITTINPKVDVSTRNIQVEATLENPKLQLRPGMFAQVEIQTGQPQPYLTLPQTAISFNPYGDVVFVVDEVAGQNNQNDLVVRQVFVTVGNTRGDQIAILKGLKEGQTVVVSGQLKLKNGSHIVVNNDLMPSDNASPKPSDA